MLNNFYWLFVLIIFIVWFIKRSKHSRVEINEVKEKNEKLIQYIPYKHNKRNGIAQTYFPSGGLHYLDEYKDDVLMSRKSFNYDGQLIAETKYPDLEKKLQNDSKKMHKEDEEDFDLWKK